MATDRASTLRPAINCCRKGGIVAIPGVCGRVIVTVPRGAPVHKGLTLTMVHSHVHRHRPKLPQTIAKRERDPVFVSPVTAPRDGARRMYTSLRHKQDGCVKVVLKPH